MPKHWTISIEHKSETTAISLREDIWGSDKSYSIEFISNLRPTLRTSGSIDSNQPNVDTLLIQAKGKILALALDPTSNPFSPDHGVNVRDGSSFVNSPHDFPLDFSNAAFDTLQLCLYNDYGMEHYCCLPHETVREHILSNEHDSPLDNSELTFSHESACKPAVLHHAVVEEGDILYCPREWFQHMEALETSVIFTTSGMDRHLQQHKGIKEEL